MRFFSILSFLVLASGTPPPAPKDAKCDEKVEVTPLAYNPKPYEPSWGVAQAAAQTSESFPNIYEALNDPMSDPWVMELISVVATGTVIAGLFLFCWCFFCCCRYKCVIKPCAFQLPPTIKPLVGKIILASAYFLVIIVGLTAFAGQGTIAGSIPEMTAGIDDIGNVLSKFVDLTQQEIDTLNKMRDSALELQNGACDFEYIEPAGTIPQISAAMSAQMITVNTELQEQAKLVVSVMNEAVSAVSDVKSQLNSADTTIGDAMDGVIKMMQEYWESYLSPATTGFALVFVFVGILGVASAQFPKAYKCTLCIMWCIAGLVLILTAVLLLLSVVLGDLCTPKPTDNFVNMVPAPEGGGEDGDFVQFFVGCKGANPIEGVADTMLDTTTTMLSDSCNLLTQLEPAEYELEIEVPTPTVQKVAKKTDAKCKAAIGVSEAGGGGLKGGMKDVETILVEIIQEIKSCKFINEPLTGFLEVGFCDGFTGGFYSMYASLFSAIWFTLLAMYLTLPTWDVIDGTSSAQQVVPASPAPAVGDADNKLDAV